MPETATLYFLSERRAGPAVAAPVSALNCAPCWLQTTTFLAAPATGTFSWVQRASNARQTPLRGWVTRTEFELPFGRKTLPEPTLTSVVLIWWRFHAVSYVPVARGLASTLLRYKIFCIHRHDLGTSQQDLAI